MKQANDSLVLGTLRDVGSDTVCQVDISGIHVKMLIEQNGFDTMSDIQFHTKTHLGNLVHTGNDASLAVAYGVIRTTLKGCKAFAPDTNFTANVQEETVTNLNR